MGSCLYFPAHQGLRPLKDSAMLSLGSDLQPGCQMTIDMDESPPSLSARVDKIRDIFASLDAKTDLLAQATGLACPKGCGRCCENPDIEVSAADWLPLAFALCQDDKATEMIETLLHVGSERCIFFESEPTKAGHCSAYQDRPTLCRQFGFSTRESSHGRREHVACIVHKQTHCDALARVQAKLDEGITAASHRDTAMALLALEPSLGKEQRPINLALLEAIQYTALALDMMARSAPSTVSASGPNRCFDLEHPDRS